MPVPSSAAISSGESPRSASENGCTCPLFSASPKSSISGAGVSATGASAAGLVAPSSAAISSADSPRSASENGCTCPALSASCRFSISGAASAVEVGEGIPASSSSSRSETSSIENKPRCSSGSSETSGTGGGSAGSMVSYFCFSFEKIDCSAFGGSFESDLRKPGSDFCEASCQL